MTNNTKKNILAIIIFIAIASLVLSSGKIISSYRFHKFGNRKIAIATTVKIVFIKANRLSYTYKVNNRIYGGLTQSVDLLKYPDCQYYVVYSESDPVLNFILPDYSTSNPLNPDTINDDYFERMLLTYAKTRTYEEWEEMGLWKKYFEKDK